MTNRKGLEKVYLFSLSPADDAGLIIDYAAEGKLIDEGLKDLPHLNDAESRIVILCHSIMDEVSYIRNISADIAEITIDRHYKPSQ